MINEREYIEVKQWEEYLIIAHLLGVADNVEQQFKKLNPEIDSYGDTDIIGIGREIQKTISKGIEKVEYEIEKDRRRNNHIKFREYNSTKTSKYDYSGNDRDSGGGGSSYDSGGDSASNKSGGGFR